jgi:hypothetical protein
MTLTELRKEDYRTLTLHFILLALCIVAAGAMFYGVGQLDAEASRELNVARGDMSQAQAALDQIEQEELTIASYIEPYRNIEAQVASGADRLDMQETFAQIRSLYSLFPIQLSIHQQRNYLIPYAPEIARPGAPVNLLITEIDTTLPLLHENDLANYLASLLDSNALILPTACSLTSSTRDRQALLRLGQHQSVDCSFRWYNFEVMAATGAQP